MHVKERTSCCDEGAGRQVASSQVYRMPACWRPARRFRFVPAPHSCLGASPTGLSPSRLLTLALRWSCQSSAVVQSGRASGEHATPSLARTLLRRFDIKKHNPPGSRAAGAASPPTPRYGARQLPRRRREAPPLDEKPNYQEKKHATPARPEPPPQRPTPHPTSPRPPPHPPPPPPPHPPHPPPHPTPPPPPHPPPPPPPPHTPSHAGPARARRVGAGGPLGNTHAIAGVSAPAPVRPPEPRPSGEPRRRRRLSSASAIRRATAPSEEESDAASR